MVSSKGMKKENKQAISEINKKLPSSDVPSKLARSPKIKKASREKIQQSSEQRSFAIDVNEEEDVTKMPTYSPDPSPNASPNVSSIPSTHFIPVTLVFELESVNQFLNCITINRNMVITAVKRDFMSCFMPGDQISGLNSYPIWNRTQLGKELAIAQKQDLQKTKLSFLVIRAWNITCLTKSQLERLSPAIDERLHYFSVKVFCNNRQAGLYLKSEKKRLLVSHIRSRTSISFSFFVGDQILAINDELLVGKSTRAIYRQAKSLMLKARKSEYVEILACRPILIRSSPAPSVDGELAMKIPKLPTNIDTVNKQDKKQNEEVLVQPLEADALEIAFRELTLLQQWIKKDAPLSICEKGASLLRSSVSLVDQTNSTTCASEKSEYGSTNNTLASPLGPPDTPRKKGMMFRRRSQQSTTFMEQPETSKVTSDISEEAELKKCDPRSGIVSYIKNVFNS